MPYHAFLLGSERLATRRATARARTSVGLAVQRSLLKLHQLLQRGDHRRVECGRLRSRGQTSDKNRCREQVSRQNFQNKIMVKISQILDPRSFLIHGEQMHDGCKLNFRQFFRLL
jgi:hypothetical protein